VVAGSLGVASIYLTGSFLFNTFNIVRQSKEGPPPNARVNVEAQEAANTAGASTTLSNGSSASP